ncbi:MAG: uroporphyrinogen-III C-methyltransferase [Candidatus Omnitrophica bacterium]|nr:uroporphyrinogen-III C-methyltransferase [Candidatus Omnitrophota bacterium]
MPKSKTTPTVCLVGAGPGDPELVTLKGRRKIEAADVILYDALVHPDILDWAPQTAEKLFVGKAHAAPPEMRNISLYNPKPASLHCDQLKINGLLEEKALKGLRVVRLKGGDPLIFGRGGEEAEYLTARGIAVEIVPGVTAAFAASASLGIPLTHRKFASQVAFVTGHEDPTKSESSLDYKQLANWRGTLVFYMGIRRLEFIAEQLIKHGKKPATPCLVVQWAATPMQKTVRGTLRQIASKARKERLGPPSLLLIGEVVRKSFGRQIKKVSVMPVFGGMTS